MDLSNTSHIEIFQLKTRLELPDKESIDLQAKFTLEHYNLFAVSLKGTSDILLISDSQKLPSSTELHSPPFEHKEFSSDVGANWTLRHIPWFEDKGKKVTALSFDEDGTLYIGLQDGTIYELSNSIANSDSTIASEIDLHCLFQLEELQILDILIWFKGNSKVILCNGGNGKFLLLPTTTLPTVITFNSNIKSMELYVCSTNLACILICLENDQNVTSILDDLDLPPPGDNLIKKSIFRRAKENIISRFGDSEKGRKKITKEGSPTNNVTSLESIGQTHDSGKPVPPANLKLTNLDDQLCRGELRKIVGKNQFFRHKENKLDVFDNDFRQVSSVYIPSYISKLFIIHKIFFGVDEEHHCLRISLVHNAMLKEFAIVDIPSKILFIEPVGNSEKNQYSVFITTQNEIYQLCLRKRPIDICCDLLLKENVSALLEVVCLALNCNKFEVFVASGDKAASEGKYAKTIIYYKLAGMNHPKIIAKFGSRGLIPAMIYFSELVDEEKHKYSGTLKDKSFMANIVMLGKIEQFARHGERNNASKLLLKAYLENNLYYTPKLVAWSLSHPELLWALQILGETRRCYPDIFCGLYHNRHKFEGFLSKKFWKLLASDWMTLFAASSEVFHWIRDLLVMHLSSLDDEVLPKLLLKLIPWRKELRHKMFNENPDLTEIIDFTVTHDSAKSAINDYVELFLMLLLEVLKRKSLVVKLPNFSERPKLLKHNSTENETSNNITHILAHLSLNTTLSASLHECACIRNEKVYTWGEARFGRLGIKNELENPRIIFDLPTPVALLSQLRICIQSVSCGQAHNIALTALGTILVWGSNTHGQLGCGPQTTWTGRPITLDTNVKFICVSAGGYHSVAIDSDHCVWTWGWGVHGQLGNNSIENCFYPGKIFIDRSLGNVIMASAGHSHTALLTSTGRALTFGCCHFGQLGHGLPSVKVKVPKVVEGLPSGAVIKFINCGVSGTALVTIRNRLFYSGLNPSSLKSLLNSSRRNKPSQESVEEKDFVSPTLIESTHLAGEISKVSIATTHLAVLTSNGYVYTYGIGKSGQLVRPDDEAKTLELIECEERTIIAADIVCAGDCTFFLERDSGKLYGCGFNSCGQLGKMESGDEASILTIRTKKRIVKVRQPANVYFKPREITGLPSPFVEGKENHHIHLEITPPVNVVNQELLEWCLQTLIKRYNPSKVKKMCINFGNNRAAAMVDQIQERHESALKYSLADADNTTESGKVIATYVEDVESRCATCLPQICTFLGIVIKHWREKNFPGSELERLFEVYKQRPQWKNGLSFGIKELMSLTENSGNESAEWMAAQFTPAFILRCFKDGENVPSDSKISFSEPESSSETELEEIDLIDT